MNLYKLTRDYKINLAWHQVTSEDANKALSEVLSGTKGINVLSPTWFSVTGTDGANFFACKCGLCKDCA